VDGVAALEAECARLRGEVERLRAALVVIRARGNDGHDAIARGLAAYASEVLRQNGDNGG
jgi:hypothetical protein